MNKRQKGKLFIFIAILITIGAIITYPKTETREEVRYEDIPCKRIEHKDANLAVGITEITQECKNGKRKIIEKVTYKNNKVEKREVISDDVEDEAVDEIKLIGTKQVVEETTSQQNVGTNSKTAPDQNIDYSDEKQNGTCKDGTAVYGNPHAKGKANSCYGHGGWVGN